MLTYNSNSLTISVILAAYFASLSVISTISSSEIVSRSLGTGNICGM